MKKKYLLVIFTTITVFSLTACTENKKTKESVDSFTITCKGKDNSIEGIKQTNKSVYNFNKDQYITDYEITTMSVYKDKETYKIYKESAEETANSNDNSNLVYNVKTDDKTKTVTFSYKIKINKDDLNKTEDKDYYKAVNVLKRAKSNPNAKCTFKGIEKNQIK